jgi:hypothetical protein
VTAFLRSTANKGKQSEDSDLDNDDPQDADASLDIDLRSAKLNDLMEHAAPLPPADPNIDLALFNPSMCFGKRCL